MHRTLPTTDVEPVVRLTPGLMPMWNVVFHNDDETTMEFVVKVLMRYFGHSATRAFEIMMTIHSRGAGIAGTYPLELAELKAQQTICAARPWYPLQVTLESAQ
jgi:ATP-dependent Clp protease adaptor protein ClpS